MLHGRPRCRQVLVLTLLATGLCTDAAYGQVSTAHASRRDDIEAAEPLARSGDHAQAARLYESGAKRLFGWDAHIALLAAQEHPDSLSALVLFALPRVGGIEKRVAPDEPPRQPTTRAAAAEDFITPGATSPHGIEAYVSQAVAANPVRVDWRDEHLVAVEAARLRIPTLFLYGANDPLLKQSGALSYFGEVATPDRAFVVLPDSDHAAHVEKSHRAWMAAVLAFLDRTTSRP